MPHLSDNIYPRPSAQAVAAVLAAYGVKDAVLSPGTRNTPLILACDAEPRIATHVVIDERSAGFVALGMAATSRRPVALVCTSGSALLNYAPALAEAYYRHVPLVVVSADRPEAWIDQADSQTIRQPQALAAVVKKCVNLPDFAADDSEGCRFAVRLCADALGCALRPPNGPVHINVPLDTPLGPCFPQIVNSGIPTVISADNRPASGVIKRLCAENAGKKILVACGHMPPDMRLNKALGTLASLPNVAVLAETLANLHAAGIITNTDAILRENAATALPAPDLVIVCGGALLSSALKKYLRSLKGCAQWHVAPYSDQLQDTFRTLTTAIETEPSKFFPTFASLLAHHVRAFSSDFAMHWRRASDAAAEADSLIINAAPWSELKAVDMTMSRLPACYNVHFSNGTAARYALATDTRHIHSVWCNRGVSGIDGTTSTAIGAAMAYSHPTLLITGDMSASYDIGALALKEIPSNFKMIVLSNSGGGIFRCINKTRELPQREHYLCAAPYLPLRQLAHTFGFRYLAAGDAEEMSHALDRLVADDSTPAILEVTVDAETSAGVFREYFKHQV